MDYVKINRDSWNERTKIHVLSNFYDVKGFIAGASSLTEIELAEVGAVEGKKLLHLQCHFGLDTLSWARKGAIVTGVDLSPIAIEKANQIKHETKLEGDFVCADIYAFGESVQPEYDIVFTSYGALCWLPCLEKWASTIANSLKSGGVFYIAEFHPVYDLVAGYSYFHSSTPDIEAEGTYTENCDGKKHTLVTWAHPLSEVINALIKAGISIDHVNEFPFSPYNCFEGLEEREKGKYYLAKSGYDVPLVFTIKGRLL